MVWTSIASLGVDSSVSGFAGQQCPLTPLDGLKFQLENPRFSSFLTMKNIGKTLLLGTQKLQKFKRVPFMPWKSIGQVSIGSMYAIYGNIYHQYTPNVSIYTIHGSYGVSIEPDSLARWSSVSKSARDLNVMSLPELRLIYP